MYVTENRYNLYQIRLVHPFFASVENLSLSPSLPLSLSLRNKGIIETDLVLRGSWLQFIETG